jgi:hypothetical protein
MTTLHRKFGRYKSTPEAWMDSWQRDWLLAERRRMARDPWEQFFVEHAER